jgi:hypothetical protein
MQKPLRTSSNSISISHGDGASQADSDVAYHNLSSVQQYAACSGGSSLLAQKTVICGIAVAAARAEYTLRNNYDLTMAGLAARCNAYAK